MLSFFSLSFPWIDLIPRLGFRAPAAYFYQSNNQPVCKQRERLKPQIQIPKNIYPYCVTENIACNHRKRFHSNSWWHLCLLCVSLFFFSPDRLMSHQWTSNIFSVLLHNNKAKSIHETCQTLLTSSPEIEAKVEEQKDDHCDGKKKIAKWVSGERIVSLLDESSTFSSKEVFHNFRIIQDWGLTLDINKVQSPVQLRVWLQCSQHNVCGINFDRLKKSL